MNSKYWNFKNSHPARTAYNREMMAETTFAQKFTILNQTRRSTLLFNPIQSQAKQSNVNQLKKEIKCLENSQFLSMKYKAHTQPQQTEDISSIQFRATGKEFYPNKKTTHLQKFKLYLKRKGKQRRVSFLLDINNKLETKTDYNCLNSLKMRDINSQMRGQVVLKKRQTPNIVKKFYRLTSRNNRSVQELGLRSNQIRGRKLLSANNKRQKENILICCY